MRRVDLPPCVTLVSLRPDITVTVTVTAVTVNVTGSRPELDVNQGLDASALRVQQRALRLRGGAPGLRGGDRRGCRVRQNAASVLRRVRCRLSRVRHVNVARGILRRRCSYMLRAVCV